MEITILLLWILLGLVLAVPGGLLVFRAQKELLRRKAQDVWPTATGQVTASHLVEEKRRQRGRGILGTPLYQTVYRPVIAYTYTVIGRPYAAERYKNSWPGEWVSLDRSKAEAVLASYAPGSTVEVHYDPNDPAQSFLEPETSNAGLIWMRGVGMALLGCALALCLWGASRVGQDLKAQADKKAIQTSAAVLALPASGIKANLEQKMGLTCQAQSFAGTTVAYRGWRCQKSANDPSITVDLYSRSAEPEKADLVWAVMNQPAVDQLSALAAQTVAAVLPESQAAAAQKWVAENYASGKLSGRASGKVQDLPLALDAPSPTRLNLILGSAK